MPDISIPGSNYQLRGNDFVSPEGTTLNQQQFIDKVKTGGVSLTEGSLKFLEGRFGPEMTNSLRSVSGFQVPPGQIVGKLENIDNAMGDLSLLMEALAKMSQEQRKSMMETKHSEFDTQIQLQQNSIDKQSEANKDKMWMGILQGGMTIAAGVLSGIGSIKGTEVSLNTWGSLSKGVEGLSGGGSSIWQQAMINTKEDESKNLELQSRKMESMTSETKDVIDNLREVHSKVKETLQAIESARSQTARSVNNM
jgi:hypothetical protein